MMNEHDPNDFHDKPQSNTVLDIESARRARRLEAMRRMYDLEEAGAALLRLLSKESRARPDVRQMCFATTEILEEWSDLAHQFSSIREDEWLAYRSQRED